MNINKVNKYAKVTFFVSLSVMSASVAFVVAKDGKVL